ncbi:MAG: hypothetical protein IJ710_08830 [Prevotella sp.]|nr:hypothetical protein [Prevotella sp.]
MENLRIVAIGRAAQYSPNSVGKDAAILQAVCSRLHDRGYTVLTTVNEDEQGALPEAEVYVSMGRRPQTLRALTERREAGALVLNQPEGVRMCSLRAAQMRHLEATSIPVASMIGTEGYWVKRGDGYAETAADVMFAPDYAVADALRQTMLRRGIRSVDVRAHVSGDLVKFYGVLGTGFFRYYYPGDDGQWKFGDEARNGQPQHYAFDEQQLTDVAERAALSLKTDIYGGDCIIRPDGQPVVIDFNDWPSFSRCRDEAAGAIAALIEQQIKKKK